LIMWEMFVGLIGIGLILYLLVAVLKPEIF
jgi:K+-transporting ATPase KdpF subunit